MTEPLAPPARRYDLDLLRVGAFGLLILYHLGMFYVPWDWHVKSRHLIPQLEPLMGLVNPWRLSLLFVISGCATRFMGDRMTAGALARSRSLRLIVPLIFGMLVVVAPQSWAQVVETRGYAGSFLDFWPRYLTGDRSFGLILPTYNHLWFVAYLWLYTMAAMLFWRGLPWVERAARPLLAGPGLWLTPMAMLGAARVFVEPGHPESHMPWADAYAHLQYGLSFAFGLVLAHERGAWTRLERGRWISAGIAVVLAAATPWQALLPAAVTRLLHEVYAWATLCALFGFAHRHVRHGGRWLSTLTEAVFPCYIVHQTAIVLAGHALRDAGLPVAVEAGLILLATVAACWGAYVLALRVPLLRLPLGLKPAPLRRSPKRRIVSPAARAALGDDTA